MKCLELNPMLKELAVGVLFLSLFSAVSASDEDDFLRCNCDEDRFLFIDIMMEIRRVSDLLIAVAYFSILIQLICFVSCSAMKFKLALVQIIAFLVLCGMNNFLSFWSYGSHSFQLMVAVTVFKFLTALVSTASVISLSTFIPMLLKVKVREFMLRKKTNELLRAISIRKAQAETSLYIRILSREIRKSVDRNTILHTTLIQLSKALQLKNCAVWMPNAARTEMELTHELNERSMSKWSRLSIPINDPDIRAIEAIDGVYILDPESPLAAEKGGVTGEVRYVAAIRVPMLRRMPDFNGSMAPACSAILTLIRANRSWSEHELYIVKAVVDQVAVALSHASILEESRNLQEKLNAQNRVLQEAKQEAILASQATNECQMALSKSLKKQVDSILGFLSLLKNFKLRNDQRLVVDAVVKSSEVLATSIKDAMDDISVEGCAKISLKIRPFHLHSTIKELACIVKCLSADRGCDFDIKIDKSLQNHVKGDEKRVFQVILHTVGNLINASKTGSFHTLSIYPACQSCKKNIQECSHKGTTPSNGFTFIRFDIFIGSHPQQDKPPFSRLNFEKSMSFSACRRLVQLMHGDLWVISNPQGLVRTMALELRLQVQVQPAMKIEVKLR